MDQGEESTGQQANTVDGPSLWTHRGPPVRGPPRWGNAPLGGLAVCLCGRGFIGSDRALKQVSGGGRAGETNRQPFNQPNKPIAPHQ